jgi:predicted RNA binding protein YcfA (HicA-like mRNA interferase family)
MPRPKKPQDVVRILREHDPRFQLHTKRGKGSEQVIYHPNINGRSEIYPMTFHKGQDVGKGMLKAIIRRFSPPDRIFG